MTITFDEIKWTPLKRMLMATTMTRIRQHVQEGDFAILSAFLGSIESSKENLERTWKLGQDVQDLGYGFVQILGKWVNPKTDKVEYERSILIYNISELEAQELASKYGQMQFLFGTGGVWAMMDTATGKIDSIGEDLQILGIDEEAQYYSEYRGRRFVLSNEDGTGAIGYLTKNIWFPRKGSPYVPGVPLPRMLKQGFENYIGSYGVATFTIPERLQELWIIDERDILDSKHRYEDAYMDKFAYDPRTGEFMPSSPGEHHASAIHNFGSSLYDMYVRGIVLRVQRSVAFRPSLPKIHYTDSLEDKKTMSFDLQYSTMDFLKAHGATDWDYQFNIDNKLLEQQTGIPRW